jgi:hypothetical protein
MRIIEKVFQPKVGKKINWCKVLPYQLANGEEESQFEIKILSKDNEVLNEHVVRVPSSVMETCNGDEVITNYLLSQLGLELDLDNTIDLVLAKLNSGTITYASGTQEENDAFLQNYATFVALNIESYKKGDIEIDDFPDVDAVSISLNENTFSIKEFVKSLISLPEVEKTSKLNDCITAITQQIEEEEEEEEQQED